MGTTVLLRPLFLGVLGLLAAASVALAQQATAQLGGRVTDQSGAVLPGVTVTATQTDTGFTRSVVTDGDGSYVMTNLPTGPYRLEVMLQGFRTYVQTGIVLQVDANAVINAVLEVGSSRRPYRSKRPRRWWTCEAPASARWSRTSGSSSCRSRAATSPTSWCWPAPPSRPAPRVPQASADRPSRSPAESRTASRTSSTAPCTTSRTPT